MLAKQHTLLVSISTHPTHTQARWSVVWVDGAAAPYQYWVLPQATSYIKHPQVLETEADTYSAHACINAHGQSPDTQLAHAPV